jgi:hypothetical protein
MSFQDLQPYHEVQDKSQNAQEHKIMITTKNSHGEIVDLTFINMTDDGMYHFQGADNMAYYLEKGDFVDSANKVVEIIPEFVELAFKVSINDRNKEVKMTVHGGTHMYLCQLMTCYRELTLREFQNLMKFYGINATINTRHEAALFATKVMDKIQELKSVHPAICYWM